jgi:ubiquitin-protein ligase
MPQNMLASHFSSRVRSGVYVVPDLDNMRLWHGVIFVRRGAWADGIFKFRIELPAVSASLS